MSNKENTTWANAQSVYSSTDVAIDVSKLGASAYVRAVWSVLSNGADKTFEDTDVTILSDVIAIAAHGYTTGMKVRLTTTGTLPAGLAVLTDYWISVVDAGKIKLASSAANLTAGIFVDITGAAGGGTHTVDVEAVAGTIKFYYSADGIAKDKVITSAGVDMASLLTYTEVIPVCPCKYIIAELGVTSGVTSLSGVVQGLRNA
jgi:hypothetical protein